LNVPSQVLRATFGTQALDDFVPKHGLYRGESQMPLLWFGSLTRWLHMPQLHDSEEWLNKQGMPQNRSKKLSRLRQFSFSLRVYFFFRSKRKIFGTILDHFIRTAKLETQIYFFDSIMTT
jgi:hypothetical protein